jgi:protein-L-isoaspartate(D-aspartate) O-methyltransferase
MLQPHRHERLIKQLYTQGIRDRAVLEALRATPRHLFVDSNLASYAYANYPLPIGYGQTISQPYIVARMTEVLLDRKPLDKVLEVGTGCGYQTAILARLVQHVYTVERIRELSLQAREHLKLLRLHNVHFKHSDGQWGWLEHAPYQGIIVTAAPSSIPQALLNQLAIGGCLVIPVGPQHGRQILIKVVRTPTHYEQQLLDDVSFVPLCKGIS